MSPWRARLGVAAVFVVGFLCGGVTLSLVRARAVSHALRHSEEWPDRVARQLGRKLDLSPAQRGEVRSILADAHAESNATLKVVRPRMVAVFDRTQARIRDVLDAKQRTKFDRITVRRRALFLKRYGGAPAAPGPASAPSR